MIAYEWSKCKFVRLQMHLVVYAPLLPYCSIHWHNQRDNMSKRYIILSGNQLTGQLNKLKSPTILWRFLVAVTVYFMVSPFRPFV